MLPDTAVDRFPLTVSPHLPAAEVVQRLLSQLTEQPGPDVAASALLEPSLPYALVTEQQRLLGILTERDLVRLMAEGRDLNGCPVSEVMTRSVVTQRRSPHLDSCTTWALLQEHGLDHLPLLHEDDTLLGVVTEQTLRQGLDPLDLLKGHRVSQVMTAEVPTALPQTSLQSLAQGMVSAGTRCVVIVEGARPIGLITAADLLRLQAAHVNSAQVSAQTVMSPCQVEVHPEDTLWTAYQEMQRRQVGQLVVVHADGSLAGLVTQDQIGRSLDPRPLYQSLQTLQRQVQQLQSERQTLITERDQARTALAERDRQLQEKQLEAEALRQSERLLHQLIDHVDAAFWMTTTDHQTLYVSARYEELWGQSCAEQYADDAAYLQRVHPEDWAIAEAAFHNLEQQESYQVEYRIILPNGIVRWVCDRAFLIRDEQGKPSRYAGFSQDISQRKHLELALQESEERWQLAIQANNDGIWDWNAPTNKISYYARWKSMLGYADDEIDDSYEAWSSRIHPDDYDRVMTTRDDYLQQRNPHYAVEYRLRAKDGSYKWVLARAQACWDEQGRVTRVVGSHSDITERKQLELELRRSESQLRDVLSHAHAAIARFRVFSQDDWQYDYFSAGCERIFGYTPEELQSDRMLWASRVLPEDWEAAILPSFNRVFAETPHTYQYRFRHKDGSLRWIEVHLISQRDEIARCWQVTVVETDISDRKRVEVTLAEQQQLLQSIIATTPTFFYIYDLLEQGNVYANGALEEILGYGAQEMQRMDSNLLEKIIHPDDMAAVYANVQNLDRAAPNQRFTTEYRIRHRDGSWRWVYDQTTVFKRSPDGQVWQILGSVLDISDRKQAEADLAIREAAARENEQFLRSIYEGSALSIFVVDVLPDGRFPLVGLNPVHERLTGWRTTDLQGKNPDELFPPDMAIAVKQHYQECVEGGKAIAYEECLTFSNEPTWWLTTLTPLKDVSQRVYRLIGTSINIGDRKRTEEALWQQAQRDQILNQVVQTIRNSLDLDQVFAATSSLLSKLLQVEWVQIVQHHPELGIWRVIYEYRPNLSLPSKLGMEIPDAGNPLSAQLKQMESVQVTDTQTLNDPINRKIARQYPGSWLLMPVPDLSDRTHQRVYGSLSLLRYQQVGTWDSWDVELVQSIADQMAIAVQQANLYEKAQRELRERQRAEAELQQLNRELERRVQERTQQLRLAIATAKMGTWEWDMETNTQRWSPENYKLLGYQTDDQGRVLDQNGQVVSPCPTREVFLSRVHPDDVEATVAAGRSALANPQDFYETEQRILWHDGSLRWRYSRGACILNAQGKAIGLVGISMDVTDRKRENEALRQSEARYERLAANVPGIIYQYLLRPDGSDAFTYVSPQCYNIFELAPEEWLRETQSVWSLIHAEQVEDLRMSIQFSAMTLQPWYVEFQITTPSGRTKWLRAASMPDQRSNGEVIWDGLIMDISEGKQAELQLQKRAEADQLLATISQTVNQSFQLDEVLNDLLERIRTFLRADRVIVYRFQPDGSGVIEKEAAASPQLSILGQVIVDPCFHQGLATRYQQGYVSVLHDRQTEAIAPCYSELLAQIQVEANLVVPILQAEDLWGLLLVHQCHAPRPWEPFEIDLLKRVGLQLGIAGQKAALYAQVRAELRQKEVLLKEVHHRVKNNLQVISSLLRMQSRWTEAPAVQAALTDSESRVRAIALIHENLYQSHDLERLEFHDYIRRLALSILAAHTTPPHPITLTFDLEPVFLNLETAIPCGILLNELVTNALKHAFPGGRSGTIHIALKQLPAAAALPLPAAHRSSRLSPPRYQLTVQDNGVGIPLEQNLNDLKSLGIQISHDLAFQLRGTLEMDNADGARFRLTFSELNYRKRL